MDAPTPSSSSHPIFISRHDILYYITVATLFAAILGGTLWYSDRNKQLGPAFDPARQFVPEGAASLEVNQTLAAFGFSKPLPFFDERNVVQSLALGVDVSIPTTGSASVSTQQNSAEGGVAGSQSRSNSLPVSAPQGTSLPFISYRIPEKSMASIRETLIKYFESMGWKMENIPSDRALVFVSSAHRVISVTLLDAPRVDATAEPAVIVALSAQ